MKKILHIASFHGNIGDNASHLGFYNILNEVGLDYKVTQLEIRKSYNNYDLDDRLVFDEKFVNYANNFDYIIFGGGGFLDYWVDGTINGTTINISEEIFNKFKCKVLITSIGSNPHRTVPLENYKKFSNFLNYINRNTNLTVALRNDGSVNSLVKDFGADSIQNIPEILDHGFFYTIRGDYAFPINDKYIALNITKDQLEMRGETIGEWYYDEIKQLITDLVSKGFHLVFVPHIHSDIEAINNVLVRLPTQLIRNNTTVAPCIQGDLGTDFIFNIYKNSELVIASRFHANVCAMKFGIPTIGLSPLKRIDYIHEQLMDNGGNITIEPGFSKALISKINSKDYISLNNEKLNHLKSKTLEFYRDYFFG